MITQVPKISVVIPCYNSAGFVPQAIRSVLDQTFVDFEILVVDDGSTDDCREVVGRFQDIRVRYLHQENRGLAGARNTGIRNTIGRYLVFLDADDILLPRKLELQAAFLDSRPGIGVAAGGALLLDQHLHLIGQVRPWLSCPELDQLAVVRNPFLTHELMFRREWLERIGGFDAALRRVEDVDCWLRLSLAGCRFGWVQAVVCGYRLHGASLTTDVMAQFHVNVEVLERFFTQPQVPAEIIAERPRLVSKMYLFYALRCYAAGQGEEGKVILEQAIEADRATAEAVRWAIVSYAASAYIADPQRFLKCVLGNLPLAVAGLDGEAVTLRQEAMRLRWHTRFYLYHEYEERAAALDAFRHRLIWEPVGPLLRDRGTWSVVLQAILGKRLMSPLRRFAGGAHNRAG